MKKFLLMIGCVLYLKGGAQINLTSSLTACYALNGSASEPINNLNGTLSAVTGTVDRFNSAGSALYFNGSTSSYAQLPNDPLLKPAGAISVSGWFRPTVLVDEILIFAKNTSSSFFTAYSLTIQDNGGGYRFRAYRQNGGGSDFADGSTVVMADNWYHVVFSIDADSIKIYVNGILEQANACNIKSFNYDGSRNVILGGTNELNFNQPYSGSMDNLRFYERKLNSDEVSALYNQDPACVTTGLPPVASFSVSDIQICEGGTLTLTDLSSNNPVAWNWTIPGAVTSSSTVSVPTYSFQNAGIYTASLVSSNSFGSSNTATQSIFVSPKPTVTASASKTLICRSPFELVTLQANGAMTYSWNTSHTTASFSVNPSTDITYTVTGTDNNGCMNSATISIKVEICTGVLENQMHLKINLFPNPVKGNVHIISENYDLEAFSLSDLTGRTLIKGRLKGTHAQMDLSAYASGIYFMKISVRNGTSTFKVILE